MFRQTGSASTSVKLGFLCLVCIVCLITVFESSKAATRTSSMTATTGSLAIAPNRPPSPTRPLPFSHVYTDPGLGRPISDSEEIPDSPLGPSGLSLAIEAALRGNPKPETEGPAKEPGEAKVKDKGTGTGTGTAKVDKKVDKKVETPTSKLKAKPKARPNVTVSAKSKPTRVGAAMNLTAHAEKVAVSRTSNATSELRPSTTTTDVTMMEVTPEAVVEEVKKKLRPARTSSPRLRPTDAPPADPEYVAICLAVKDQHADLSEFFRHHYYQIGIRKFYVMDDGSAPPLFQVPDWGIPREALHFSYFTPDTRRSVYQQLHAYDECWRLHRHSHTWIANLDADEYLEMTSTTRNETLVSFLQEFEDDDEVGAVGVNWITHTSSGHLTRPPSTRKGFTTCIEDDDAGHNRHIKSIVRTDRYRRSYNAHHVDLASGTITVGEHGDECDGPFRTPITRDRIALHHYALGSWEQFQEKLSRGNGMGDPKGQWFWDDVESLPSYTCDSMAKYEP